MKNRGLKVIFDSSFLMAVAEHPTTWSEDISGELGKFEPVVLECVVDEMRRLANGEGRKARYARVALELAGGFGREPCGGAGPDDEIVSAAQGPGKAVATIDSNLLETLVALGVRVVTLRKGRVSLN